MRRRGLSPLEPKAFLQPGSGLVPFLQCSPWKLLRVCAPTQCIKTGQTDGVGCSFYDWAIVANGHIPRAGGAPRFVFPPVTPIALGGPSCPTLAQVLCVISAQFPNPAPQPLKGSEAPASLSLPQNFHLLLAFTAQRIPRNPGRNTCSKNTVFSFSGSCLLCASHRTQLRVREVDGDYKQPVPVLGDGPRERKW